MGYLDDMQLDLADWIPRSTMSPPASSSQYLNTPIQPNQQTHPSQFSYIPSGHRSQHYDQPAPGSSQVHSHSQQLSQPGLSQRRGAPVAPIDVARSGLHQSGAQRRNAVSDPVDSTTTATQLQKDVIWNIVERLQARGQPIEVNAIDEDAAKYLFWTYATDEERAAVDEELAVLAAQQAQAEQAQAEKHSKGQSVTTQLAEQAWYNETRAQLSPGRRADGTAGYVEGQGGEVPYEDTTKYERPILHKSCIDCRREKRKCDREEKANKVCTPCEKKQARNGGPGGNYNASQMCYHYATNAYIEFVNNRADKGGKAVAMNQGWQTGRYQRRKGREEAKKVEEQQKQRPGEQE